VRSRPASPSTFLSALLALGLLAPGGAAPAGAALLPGACNPDTVMTFVGLDTRSGRALFHLFDPGGDRPPALLDVPSEGGLAYFHRPGRRVFGGSVGPGPVLAFERCGETCLKVFRWRDWAWTPVGGELEVPPAVTVHATWDRSGVPWVVLLGETETATRGRQRAWAFRWESAEPDEREDEGSGRWRRHGPLSVDAVGEPAAVPDPYREDAILVGSGRFVPDGFARSWLSALPQVPRERMAEVFPLRPGPDGGIRAVVLTDDGGAFVTDDGGAGWQRADWSPPRAEGPELLHDRPTGDRTGPLGVVWVDARAPRPGLVLTEIPEDAEVGAEDGWREVARVPLEVKTDTGVTLTFEHYLRPDGRRWWLLTPCVDTPETSGLVVRGPGDLEHPRFVTIAEP
jgi:hypothetical protein